MTDNQRLGRGLSSLLGEDVSRETIAQISIHNISAGAHQPRKYFDGEQLRELVESIKIKGVIQPIIVRKNGEKYECVAGERRWRAAIEAGLKNIPAIIKDYSDRETLEIGILENLHRQDLNAIEEAEAYNKLLCEFNHTQESLAQLLGKNRSTLANMLRLLSLPQTVQDMVRRGELTASHARNLVGQGDAEERARAIIDNGLTVRQVEQLKDSPKKHNMAKQIGKNNNQSLDILDLQRQLSNNLGAECLVKWNGYQGSITIKINNLDNFDAIIKKLS